MNTNIIDLPLFFPMALQIVELLQEWHQQHDIPRGINPETIALRTEGEDLTLQWLDAEHACPGQAYAYLSPEHAGRMMRQPDLRSDMYGIGILFYEWLTGASPFKALTGNEWTHAHMALLPVPVKERQPSVPPMLNDLVMKLLSKSPEDRYQRAYGLQDDLQRCSDQWRETGTIDPFPLGTLDARSRLRLPSRLYGRDREWQQLLKSYERCRRGSAEMLFIGGHAGIGKSTFVKALQPRVQQDKGYFIFGKSEAGQESTPYAPFIAAFAELVRQVVAGGEEQSARWKARLTKALGRSGSVLAQVVPELTWLIGEQPAVEALSPVEATNRFRTLFGNLIQAFADEEHPLVVGLDDLQWADSASLQLLRELWNRASLKHVLIIGTYRDHEGNEKQGLEELFPDMPDSDVGGIGYMNIHALSYPEVKRYMGDALDADSERIRPLADVLYRQTAGNPLYLKQLLQTCHDRKWLYFDRARMRWDWDMQAIQGLEGFQHVEALIRSRIGTLPEGTRIAMRWAGVLGASFDIDKLSLVTGKDIEQLIHAVSPAVSEGWIMVEERRLTFLHDQVRKVAYDLIPEQEKDRVHLEVGRSLLRSKNCAEVAEEQLFEVVHHLNTGSAYITDRSEAERLARLNLRAGRKAKASAAYGQASELLKMGARFVESDGWSRPDALYFKLVLERTECLYFCGDIRQAEADLRQLLEHADQINDRSRIYSIMIMMYSFHKRMDDAVKIALQAMAEFGFSIPSSSSRPVILAEIARTQLALAKPRMRLTHLSTNQDPEHQALAQIVTVSSSVIFIVDPAMAVVLFAKYVRMSLSQGLGNAFSIALGSYAITMAFGFGKYRTAQRLAETAWQYAEHSDSLLLKGKAQLILALVKQYLHPQEVVPMFEKAGQLSMECGDMVSAGNAIACHMIAADNDLERLEEVCNAYEEKNASTLDEITLRVLHISKRYVELLRQETEDHTLSFNIPGLSEEIMPVEGGLTNEEEGNWYYFYTCKLEVAFVYSRYSETIALAEQSEQFEREMLLSVKQKHCFYHALAIMRLYAEASELGRGKHRKALRKAMQRMRKWAKIATATTLSKYRTVQAEYARLHREYDRAARLYDQAIHEARQAGEYRDEAIAAETAANFYMQRNDRRLSEAYLRKACEAYYRWGATRKSKSLRGRIPEFPELPFEEIEDELKSDPKPNTDAPSSEAPLQDIGLRKGLDYEMFQQIANIQTDHRSELSLAENFLQSALRATGAERGLVLFGESSDFIIEAEQEINRNGAVSPAQAGQYSTAVVQFVHRTKESVVLGDALQSHFAYDAYMIHRSPRSLLCLPIRDSDRRDGVLYLENNQMSDAFKMDRLDLLEMIFSRMMYLKLWQSEDRMDTNRTEDRTKRKPSLIESLTNREMEIVHLMADGLSNKQIALRLAITEGTVKIHANNIYGKLQVNKRVQAIKKARELQLIH